MKRILLTFIGIALSLGAVGVVAYRVFVADPSRTNDLLTQWKAVGGAEVLARLKPTRIPEEDNAATAYRTAFSKFDQLSEEEYVAISMMELTPEARAIVQSIKPIIDRVTEASRRPQCNWDSPFYDGGFGAQCSHLQTAQGVSRAIAFEAQVCTQQGDLTCVTEMLLTLRRFARHLATESTMLGLLVAISVDARALESFSTVYSDNDLPSEQQLEIFKAPLVSDAMIRSVLLNEGTMQLQTLRQHYDQMPLRIGYHKDVQALLEWQLDLIKEFDDSSGRSNSRALKLPPMPSDARISEILIPDLNSVFSQTDRARRNELAVEIVIALRQYHAEHGEYPASWDMPIDPLSGKPMIYQRTEDGFLITGSLENDERPLEWRWK